MAKVRSMLFTIGLMMLSSVILVLAILISGSFQKSELAMSNIGALDRIYDLDISIQNILKNLFYSGSGISLEVDSINNFVSFEENLPNKNSAIFNFTVLDFKNFTELNFNNVSLNLARIVKELPLVILPYDIEYKHLNFGERTIEITPKSINFNKYEVFLVPYGNITSCPAVYDEETDFDVYVQADSPVMECPLRKIEPDIENKVITTNGFVYLRAYLDGKLVITANNTEVKVKTKIWLNPLGVVSIQYPDNIVNINLKEIGISKASSVVIK